MDTLITSFLLPYTFETFNFLNNSLKHLGKIYIYARINGVSVIEVQMLHTGISNAITLLGTQNVCVMSSCAKNNP